jgi:hypothetical protein
MGEGGERKREKYVEEKIEWKTKLSTGRRRLKEKEENTGICA